MFLVLSKGNVTNLQPLVCSTQFGDGLGLCQGGSLRDQDLQDQNKYNGVGRCTGGPYVCVTLQKADHMTHTYGPPVRHFLQIERSAFGVYCCVLHTQ
jgi:hypothetical protein